jgi:DNA-binding LytR/AlgR family response regulator
MNCIAIDDEPLALDVIKDFAGKIPFLDLVAVFTNPINAIQIIRDKKIELVFLDIQMPHITGLDFIKTLQSPPLVIFTTAYSEYALDGFEVNAVDYLVKPFSFERFLKSVQKAYDLYNLNKTRQWQNKGTWSEGQPEYILVKVEYSTVRIDLDKILYIEGLKDYVKIYTGPKFILTKTTLKNLEERLPSNYFLRVHKSYIVSVPKIDLIENNRIKLGDKYIPVGNQYRPGFYSYLEKFRL